MDPAPTMSADLSLDLRDLVADLADRADRVCGDKRKLWIEVDRVGFRILRAVPGHLRYEVMGYGSTIDAAVSRAEDFLADLQVTAETEAMECDRLEAVQTAARHAAE